MNERNKYLNIYSGEPAKIYETQNIRGKIGGGYGRICWGEGLLELMKQWQVQSLLDVGCGYGNFCDAATLFASRVYGLDIASVATGNVVDNPDIEFFDGQAKSLPLPDGAVEWVTSFDCLEHCLEEDIDEILNEFNRVSVKGFALSISYEPCVFEGVALHMTVRPESWWMAKLKRYGRVSKEGRVPITGVPYLICRKPAQKRLICYCTGAVSTRLKAMAACDDLSRRMGRELTVVWPSKDPLCPVAFSEIFSNTINTLTRAALLELPSCKIYAYIKDVAGSALMSGDPTLRMAVRKWGSSGVTELTMNDDQDNLIVFFGHSGSDLPAVVNPEFIGRLEPVPHLKDRIDAGIQTLGLDKSVIGVHARGTDFGVGVKPYALQMIKALDQNQAQQFLVCSDEAEYEQQLQQVFKGKVCIRAKSDWITKQDTNRGWSLSNMMISKKALMECVIDLYLLARTDFRIYHESSVFAQLAKSLAHGRSQQNGQNTLPFQISKTDPSAERLVHSRPVAGPAEKTGISMNAGMDTPHIHYVCPDTHEHSAGINRLYRHVSQLHAAGFPVSLLHMTNGFQRQDMPSVPVHYFHQIGPNPNAIFVIPEGMPKVMYQLKDHPGRRFVIALSWHYIYSTLPDGLDWRHMNIERVLAVSPLVGEMVSWSMGLPVHFLDSSIDHQRFFYDPKTKQRKVVFIQRKAVNIDRLKRLLESRNHDYIHHIKWIGLDRLSQDHYADQVRQATLFVNTSMAEGFPTSCLEAMAAGAIVAGYASGGGIDILVGKGPHQNCILAPNGDYVSLAYGLEDVLNDLAQDRMARWASMIQNAQATASAFTYEKEHTSLMRFWHQFGFNHRKESNVTQMAFAQG